MVFRKGTLELRQEDICDDKGLLGSYCSRMTFNRIAFGRKGKPTHQRRFLERLFL